MVHNPEIRMVPASVREKNSSQHFRRRQHRDIWRRRFNHKLCEPYKKPDIVVVIKINRLGHVQRMDGNRLPVKLLNDIQMLGDGRLRGRCKDTVKLDFRTLEIVGGKYVRLKNVGGEYVRLSIVGGEYTRLENSAGGAK